MTLFCYSLERMTYAGMCLLLCGLLLQPGRLVADDPKPDVKSVEDDSDAQPLQAEKPEPDASEPVRLPKPETPEQRRERIRYHAVNGMGSMSNLIGIPQIQRELNLSEAQQFKIDDQIRKLHIYVRYQFLEVQKMPKHEQASAMRELHLQTRPVVEQRQQDMLNVLTDEQRRRLLGISLQMRGPKALLDEEVVKLLELTDEQAESILTILEEHDAKLHKLATKSPASSQTPLVVIRPKNSRKSLLDDVEKQILDVLTASQRAKFKELQGKPYLIPPDGRPTLIEPPEEKSEDEEKKTLKELTPDK